jgi:hypothetical protein
MERLYGAEAERGQSFDERFFNERWHSSCTDQAGKGELLADGFDV